MRRRETLAVFWIAFFVSLGVIGLLWWLIVERPIKRRPLHREFERFDFERTP